MKKTSPHCDRCPYKLGLIKTLVDPCEQCKEMHKKAVRAQTVYEFWSGHQKRK